MLPSLFKSADETRAWNVVRAAACGAALGTIAALFKVFGPMRQTAGPGLSTGNLLEIAGAALAFAALCAGACLLRNFLARRLIWPELRR